jgi:hypothetical protein
MTRVEYKRNLKLFKIGVTLTSVALFLMVLMFVQTKSYQVGVNRGWQECIEENNLYERYANEQ